MVWICVGAVLALVAAEAVLRMLPVAKGLFRTTHVQRWPLEAFGVREPYTYSMTWEMRNAHHGMTNNYGHLAPFDYVRESRPIIVLGDSFIEAQMLDYADTLQAQLAGLLGGSIPVYGFGFSGNSSSEYLALGMLARSEFAPRAAVVVMIDGDVSESLIAQTGHYFFREDTDGVVLDYRPMGPPSLVRKLRESIGDSSLYRYVFANLQFTVEEALARVFASSSASRSAASAPAPSDLRRERAAADFFLREFSARSSIPPACVVFLFDSDRYTLYSDAYVPVRPKDSPELLRYFTQAAIARGYRVVDLAPVFAEDFARHRQKLDFYPLDRHWNRKGHGIAAREALAALQKQDSAGRQCTLR